MAISGVDDMQTFVDTGIATLPTTRPATTVDIHSLVPGLVEHDTGTNPATAPKSVPAVWRSSGQRR